MNISGINSLSQNNVSSKQSAPDSRESSLRKKISNLQEELRTISNDQEMSDDQKTRKKQSAREQIQDLNSELRQYQIQKRQEEAAQKQEAAKQALKETDSKQTLSEEHQSVQATDGQSTHGNSADGNFSDDNPVDGKSSSINNKAVDTTGSNINSEKEEEPQPALLGSKESGVLITLSSTKEQIADMGRIRTALEGRQRTAPTEEEKASLQGQINKVASGIGKKIIITEDAISSLHKDSGNKPDKAKQTANALEQHKEELKIYADQQLDAINRTGIINNKKMFDNISIIFN
ncbi:MAG: FlxA-like family protein [Lachnoclostridium sp.]|nr:FlxA-like family protein [Lachnospira sp.]MCM1248220.1 FlxA-like family protein [Lachnoclostridium sp.]MCM1534992.1 FlxA-like family protein [Clostridium sp.]